MNCSDCKRPMPLYIVEGKPTHCCYSCGKTVVLPMGGPTTQHKLQTRTQTANAIPREPSAGEVSFAEAWENFCPSMPLRTEYKFHDFREFRLDFAHVESKVGVEMDSSVHRTKGRFAGDIAKHNALMAEGWIYFRTTRTMLDKDVERTVCMIAKAIRRRLAGGCKQASPSSE